MTKRKPDYFRYFVSSPEATLWGLEVSACGQTRIGAGAAYPPEKHPEDHHFDWEHGRSLEALQIVLINDGHGCLEWKRGHAQVIEAGTVFALPPHVWHRYRPDPQTGWNESWMEVRGPLVDRLVRKGIFSMERGVRSGALSGDVEAGLATIHSLALNAGPGFSPQLASAAFGALMAFATSSSDGEVISTLKRAVLDAERELAENHAEPINVEALAKRLGVSYSHFRRAFKTHTGFAPWQYVMNLRLMRARRLLAASDITLEETASRLGFSSAFHFSTTFKQAYGTAPDTWRRKLHTQEKQ